MVTRLVPSPGNLERSRWSLFHRPRWDDKTLGECANGNTRPQKKDQKTCVHIMLIFVRVLPVMNEGSRIETGHHHFPGCKKKTTSQYIALSFANETWHQIFLDVSLKCVGHLIFHREISSKIPASSAQFSCPLEVT